MTGIRRSVGFALVVLAATICGRAEDASKLAKPTSYVVDLAGVIDETSKASLEALSQQVYTKAHATIEVVTVHTTGDDSIEEFATKLEDNWKVGPKGTEKGVLMVFAIDDRHDRIEVGYGLEGILNDAKVGDIGRTMRPLLQQSQYGAAALTGEQAIANVIAADAGVTLDAAAPVHTYRRQAVRQPSLWRFLPFVLIVLFFLISGRGGRGGGGGLMWFLLGSMMNGGGGSGFGGGGGRGGDGDSGGGGGGDFGGGFGGGSGGGGASGDW